MQVWANTEIVFIVTLILLPGHKQNMTSGKGAPPSYYMPESSPLMRFQLIKILYAFMGI